VILLESSIAERINDILKDEYLNDKINNQTDLDINQISYTLEK